MLDVTAHPRHHTDEFLHGGSFGGHQLGMESSSALDKVRVEVCVCGKIRLVSLISSQTEDVARDDSCDGEHIQQGMGGGVLSGLVSDAGLDGLKELFNDPTRLIPVDELPGVRFTGHLIAAVQNPTGWHLTFWRLDFDDFDNRNDELVSQFVSCCPLAGMGRASRRRR